MWSKIRFRAHVYGKNSVEKEESTLCLQQRLVIVKRRWKLRTNNMIIQKKKKLFLSSSKHSLSISNYKLLYKIL